MNVTCEQGAVSDIEKDVNNVKLIQSLQQIYLFPKCLQLIFCYYDILILIITTSTIINIIIIPIVVTKCNTNVVECAIHRPNIYIIYIVYI